MPRNTSHPLDCCKKLGLADRFRDIVIHSRLKATIPVARHGVSRHSHDRHLPELIAGRYPAAPQFAGTNGLRRLQAIHDRHLHVHQHQIEVLIVKQSQCFLAIRSNKHLVTSGLKKSLRKLLIDQIVFGQKNVQGDSSRCIRSTKVCFDADQIERVKRKLRTPADRQRHRVEQIVRGNRFDDIDSQPERLQSGQFVTLAGDADRDQHWLRGSFAAPSGEGNASISQCCRCVEHHQPERKSSFPIPAGKVLRLDDRPGTHRLQSPTCKDRGHEAHRGAVFANQQHTLAGHGLRHLA